MNLRKLAAGKECQVRSALCNRDPATTVLAHWRQIGISGMGLKAPDILGAWCCSSCHRVVDADTHSMNREGRELMLLRGVMRTQYQLIKLGIMDANGNINDTP